MKITREMRRAAVEALGNYAFDDEQISDAVEHYGDDAVDIERRLGFAERAFDLACGRSVELAEEIDNLRIALAIAQLPK